MSNRNTGSAVGTASRAFPGIVSAPCPQVLADPVLSAAYEVLLEAGPRRATLTEVARRAEISRMTLYRRYSHLSALVNAVLTAEFAALMSAAEASAEGDCDRARIAMTVASCARAMANHPLMVRIIEIDPESLAPLLMSRRGSTQRAAEVMIEHMLAQSADDSVQVTSPAVAARTIVTATSAFVVTESLARAEGDAGSRWTEFTRLVEGYLS